MNIENKLTLKAVSDYIFKEFTPGLQTVMENVGSELQNFALTGKSYSEILEKKDFETHFIKLYQAL